MASGGVPERAGMQQQVSDPPDEPDGATATFMGIVNKHARFLNEVSKLQVRLPFFFLFKLVNFKEKLHCVF